ncbi:MAG: valine--tRNA ligase [Bacteroidota bacterium]
MDTQLAKSYSPTESEQKWYVNWINENYFAPRDGAGVYSILMPPPNVTGILHFGHILNNTLQDLYIRRNRMKGASSVWFPGLDHAGIATQTKVEQDLRKEGKTRHDLGREEFLKRVWEWKDKYGGVILKQLRTLGASPDWDRTLFTMDESASNAVREVFIRLFDEDLIYRGKRIVNWSPLAQSAVSDEEVIFKEMKEYMYFLRYYIEGMDSYMVVATARPETLFGDVAVAVNPKDTRYTALIGKKVRVPLSDRMVPIIADDYADPEFGTGCVKITPAHDPNDYQVGLRHNLEAINTINPDATLNELAGDFKGLDRFEARKQMVELLKERLLIENIQDYTHNVGYSERGGEPIEPYLSDQWFVKMAPLAEPALKVVQDGEIKFYPEHWTKTYEHWMTNIRDWCISRQLWWGHRIPVYYADNGEFTAAHNEEEARKKLGLNENAVLKQDEDVLDTWFSSWLWPMTTMGWLADGKEEVTEELQKYLPTNLLVTGPDIIFFWVARMIMATLKFKQQIPFKDVYFTSTVRDGKGRKMSKSLGNSPDPLDVIAKYGADAVRFTMIYLAPLGQDVRMEVNEKDQDVPAMDLGRNFANKIWNAGRFLLMKRREAVSVDGETDLYETPLSKEQMTAADKWILSRFHSTIRDVDNALENYKVTEYSKLLYDFIWKDFCDWYLEIMKAQMNESGDIAYRQQLSRFALDIYDGILKLLHPVMPFITEELWHAVEDRDVNESISVSDAPEANEENIDRKVEENFENLQLIVDEIRRLRSSANIPPSEKLPVVMLGEDIDALNVLHFQKNTISSLGRCSTLEIGGKAERPVQALSSVVRGVEIFVSLAGKIDIEKERARLLKEVSRLENLIGSTEKKLSNEGFTSKAPEQVITAEREKLASMKDSLLKTQENLASLK